MTFGYGKVPKMTEHWVILLAQDWAGIYHSSSLTHLDFDGRSQMGGQGLMARVLC